MNTKVAGMVYLRKLLIFYHDFLMQKNTDDVDLITPGGTKKNRNKLNKVMFSLYTLLKNYNLSFTKQTYTKNKDNNKH